MCLVLSIQVDSLQECWNRLLLATLLPNLASTKIGTLQVKGPKFWNCQYLLGLVWAIWKSLLVSMSKYRIKILSSWIDFGGCPDLRLKFAYFRIFLVMIRRFQRLTLLLCVHTVCHRTSCGPTRSYSVEHGQGSCFAFAPLFRGLTCASSRVGLFRISSRKPCPKRHTAN